MSDKPDEDNYKVVRWLYPPELVRLARASRYFGRVFHALPTAWRRFIFSYNRRQLTNALSKYPAHLKDFLAIAVCIPTRL